jgi:hypothetical protein
MRNATNAHIGRLAIEREQDSIALREPVRDDAHFARVRVEAVDLIRKQRRGPQSVVEPVADLRAELGRNQVIKVVIKLTYVTSVKNIARLCGCTLASLRELNWRP